MKHRRVAFWYIFHHNDRYTKPQGFTYDPNLHAQLSREMGYDFRVSDPQRKRQLNEKQILCFQCYSNKIKLTRSRYC